jgi:hypothetical protein
LSENDLLPHIVHLSDYISKKSGYGVGLEAAGPPDFEEGVLKFLGIQPEELDDIAAVVIDSVKKLEEEFQEQTL